MNYKTFRRKAGIVLSSAFAMSEKIRSGFSSLSINFNSPQLSYFNTLPSKDRVLYQQQSFIKNKSNRFEIGRANNAGVHF